MDGASLTQKIIESIALVLILAAFIWQAAELFRDETKKVAEEEKEKTGQAGK